MEVFDDFGNIDLLQRRKTAFLCSRQVPVEYHARILQWANEVTKDQCIVCGRGTSIERQVSDILLQRGIPLIWVALTLDEVKSEIDTLRPYVIQDRMLILALFGPEDATSKSQQAFMRNMAVLEHSDQIVVGYRTLEGTLDRQLAGREVGLEIVATCEQHRYQDFLQLSSSKIMLESIGDEFRIVQQRQLSNGAYQREVLVLAPQEVVRLRNVLDRAVEQNGWAESQYADIRETYANAYRPWSPEDELLLRQLSIAGKSDQEISQLLGRQPSAVASRLQKIIDEENLRAQLP